MKKILPILLLVVALSGCDLGITGNGNVTEKAFPVEAFTTINASGTLDIFIRQDGSHKALVKTDENLMDLVEVYVENDVLYLSTKRNIRKAKAKSVYLSVDNLEALQLAGAISVQNAGQLKVASLNLESSGAAEIDLDLETSNLKAMFSGATEVELKGTAQRVNLEASGASELDWEDFSISELKMHCSGATEANVWVTDKLWLTLSGASDVVYKGKPTIERQKISGPASFKPKS
jgi:hypothetical protein